MTEAEKLYTTIGEQTEDAVPSKMFGKPCLKVNGKAYACFFQDEMVFKLTGTEHTNALALEGSKLFDPSGKGRAMKEWVQVPFAHSKQWRKLSDAAMNYVKGA